MRMSGLSLPETNPIIITANNQIIDVIMEVEDKIHRGTVVAGTLTTTTFKSKVTAKTVVDEIIMLMSAITDVVTMILVSGPGHVIANKIATIVNHAHNIFISMTMILK